ncbi:MAG: serine/threonine-protein phosphatase [Nocardioides sp.]|nr:serine/threonine-protein phosphatase [Nocardioides sp.]
MSSQAFAARMRNHAVRRHMRDRELRTALVLGLLSVVLAVLAGCQAGPLDWIPPTVLAIPLLLGSLLLGPRTLGWFVVSVLVMALVVMLRSDHTTRDAATFGVLIVLGGIANFVAVRRIRLGVGGLSGESMLLDLSNRLDQGGMPELPAGWLADSAVISATGTRWAGDFVVAAVADGRFEVVVVDVSGKGEQAGPRALQLSGAFGGLLGAVPSDRFLPAANRYLLRQGWDEGFATAVHLSVDLADGSFELRTAGHPPALVRRAPAGRWEELETLGPVLGLMDDVDFDCARGVLELGDVVVLYTDGVIEAPGSDLDNGISDLSVAADTAAVSGRSGGARRLLQDMGSRADDRALVVIGRR